MKTPWLLRLGMVAMGLLHSTDTKAQPDPMAKLKQDMMQCLQAQTPAQCRETLPACDRTHQLVAALPPGDKTDEFQDRLLNDWGWCEEKVGRYT